MNETDKTETSTETGAPTEPTRGAVGTWNPDFGALPPSPAKRRSKVETVVHLVKSHGGISREDLYAEMALLFCEEQSTAEMRTPPIVRKLLQRGDLVDAYGKLWLASPKAPCCGE